MLVFIIAIFTGLCYAALLYFRNKKQHYGKTLTTILFILRTVTVSIVVLLFFNPFLKIKNYKEEAATIIVAQDNSSSLILTKDSTFYKTDYLLSFDTLINRLGNNFRVDKYLFGNKSKDFDSIDYSDYYTDISEVLNNLKKKYYKRNVGAVVLLSDGICNKSSLPEQNIESYPFPIYSVTLGDTTSYPDIYIKDIFYNKTSPSNTMFPIRLVANALNCRVKEMEIRLLLDNEVIEESVVNINSNRFSILI